jgi:hypothetical protein
MDDEKDIRIEQWDSGKHKNLKYQSRYFNHGSINNEQYIGPKTQVNDGYIQLFKSTELSTDLLPKNERVYLSFNSRCVRRYRAYKHGVSRTDKMEKQRLNAKEANDALTDLNQCISPQSSHSSADDPQI